MKKKVVIFGINDFAELAYFYLTTDSDFEVVAFSINKEYLNDGTSLFQALPVLAFEDIEKTFPPDKYSFFAPMSPAKMNRLRENVYFGIKQKGYELISYISSKAIVLTRDIGENCFILESNVIQPFVKVGNNVILWSGNHIGHHSVIGNHVMFTSHVVLSGHCIVGDNCLFGVNSTIRDNISIAAGTFLAMSSALTANSEEWCIYKGFPALKGKISSKDL
jgi:sugar O-acyltransferase (sialic acid O-acetyltransferase NeuD family)